MREERRTVEIRDFPGMAIRIDPDDIEPGAAVIQINMQSTLPGKLTLRPGMVPVTFEEE